ncbi:uncharacterized protein BDR25DRAFT_319123 [Lindgomyces ingoldianus]|uniref:Uncharacterized protein n=1 Tax=Lindgomyces ingoldianus TaxID=673940 RepID=A0ACB6QCE9_9PLEO|nr:uncharacterized protein BDR25DRAFT_319123 [Lindgomyces ingoldianus]KAF2464604.1 hypothetical protein BDR25DRAFT_319123 [Lindgomyces ingoldianus]
MASAAGPQGAKLSDVFIVKGLQSGGDHSGDCTRTYNDPNLGKAIPYLDTLEKWWEDTTKLVMHAYDGLKKACIPCGSSILQSVINWLATFGNLNRVVNNRMPVGFSRRLYCNTDWAAETESVFDVNGVEQEKVVNGQTVKKNVHDPNDFSQDPGLSQKSGSGCKGLTILTLGATYAYWVHDLRRYFFLSASDRPPGPDPRHYCNHGTLAVTDDGSLPGTVTVSFCEISFVGDCHPSQNAQCFHTSDESSGDRRVRDRIIKRQPRSLTMLHEFVHLVQGTSLSPDHVAGIQDCYGVENVLKSIRLKNDNSHLPEAYAYFAYALWLSTARVLIDDNNPNGGYEQLYDWSDGTARKA